MLDLLIPGQIIIQTSQLFILHYNFLFNVTKGLESKGEDEEPLSRFPPMIRVKEGIAPSLDYKTR
jgi:hypothetical protein